MTSLADNVSGLVLSTYNSIAKTGKPVIRTNGTPEWTILSGIVAHKEDSTLHCLSLATGVKCLPHSKVVQANGLALHDSHAEVLAMRGFNSGIFLLDELVKIRNDDSYHSKWLDKNADGGLNRPLFVFQATKIYLFISGSPCGDASLDLLAEDPAYAIPWTGPSQSDKVVNLHGHEYIWERGKVRFKPGRGDSPESYSKSCSDKIALKTCTSLLNSLLSTIIDPSTCYLDYLVVPQAAYHQAGFRRAFEQRLGSVDRSSWPHGFRIQHVKTLITTIQLPSTLIPPAVSSSTPRATAGTSIIYVDGRQVEVLVGGVKMGRKFPPNSLGASSLCRACIAKDFFSVITKTPQFEGPTLELSANCTYSDLKRAVCKEAKPVKDTVREALGGWTTNAGDGEFTVAGCPHSVDG